MIHKLRFRARGGLLVRHLGAGSVEGQVARFIGRRFDPSMGDGKTVAGGWPAMPEGEEVLAYDDHLHDYRRHVNERALWPGDEATAAKLGVSFDPSFGGEFDAPAAPEDK